MDEEKDPVHSRSFMSLTTAEPIVPSVPAPDGSLSNANGRPEQQNSRSADILSGDPAPELFGCRIIIIGWLLVSGSFCHWQLV